MTTTKNTYTLDEISSALNSACDEIAETAELPDSGARDALNLLVNYGITKLENPKLDLESCVTQSYAEPGGDVTLEDVIEWIHE
jgi:hypothetical protein